MQTSLPFDHPLSIVRLTGDDAKQQTDDLAALRRLLLANEPMYPGISPWVERKVLPGLRTGERVAYIGYQGERPVASAVVKRGRRAKFCHLRIEEDLRSRGLGELFFTLMAHDVRAMAQEIHFTLPESLWEDRFDFFRSFGFVERVASGTQYRLFDRELHCAAPFKTVWHAALERLSCLMPRITTASPSEHAVLLSLKPRWATAILSGRKRVEVRRAFSKRWARGQAFLYASQPVQQIVGEARISAVTDGRPEEIWARFGKELGCAREEFEDYARGAEQIFAIELEEPRSYASGLSLEELRRMLGDSLRPPQSYATLASSPGWNLAAMMATLLGGETMVRRATTPSEVKRRRAPQRAAKKFGAAAR